MAALLQVQEPKPGLGLYWLDISRKDDSMPRLDFSPVYFDVDNVRVSSTLHESLPGAKLRAPFISEWSTYLFGSGLKVDLFFCNGGNDENFTQKREISLCDNVTYITYQSWTNVSRGYFINDPRQYDFTEFKSHNYPSTRSFDFAFINSGKATFAVWVNGTNVYPVEDDSDGRPVLPQTSFPFTRLASINVPENSSSYLYHQINETTLAEEQYDDSLHEWLTFYIPVPIS